MPVFDRERPNQVELGGTLPGIISPILYFPIMEMKKKFLVGWVLLGASSVTSSAPEKAVESRVSATGSKPRSWLGAATRRRRLTQRPVCGLCQPCCGFGLLTLP